MNSPRTILVSFVALLLTQGLLPAQEQPSTSRTPGFYKDLYMDGGINLTSRKRLYAAEALEYVKAFQQAGKVFRPVVGEAVSHRQDPEGVGVAGQGIVGRSREGDEGQKDNKKDSLHKWIQ